MGTDSGSTGGNASTTNDAREVIPMQDEHSFRAIPRPTLERLPKYLNYLRCKSAEGLLTTSSTAIAQDMHLSPIQVRKDLAFVTSGKPRVGHDTQQLIERLEHFLDRKSTRLNSSHAT